MSGGHLDLEQQIPVFPLSKPNAMSELHHPGRHYLIAIKLGKGKGIRKIEDAFDCEKFNNNTT